MANLIKVQGDRAELPARSIVYSLTPPHAKLQAALEAFEALRRGHAAHRLGSAERAQTAKFLVQFGRLLYSMLFPTGRHETLDGDAPLWIAPMGDWSAFPWELLHDGREWLALRCGVFRTTWPPPAEPSGIGSLRAPVRVLALSARPLSLDGVENTQEPGWFERFVSDPALLADQVPASPRPVHYRILPHATVACLDSGLAARPDVLYFSGRATGEGWWLETERGAPELLRWDALLGRLKQAATRGLRLVLLKDTLGFGQPLTMATRAADMQRAGMPSVVRLDGIQSRRREQEYVRTLMVYLSTGHPLGEAHLRTLQGMFKPPEMAWDWMFPRVFEIVPAPRFENNTVLEEGRPRELPLAEGGGGSFATAPVPPLQRPRRRCMDRAAVSRRLVEVLQPDASAASSLVFLHGPAGSGKTVLALSVAQRLRRRYGQVLYLTPRLLLPDPWQVAEPRGIPREDDRPADRLLDAIGRHLGLVERPDTATLEANARLNRHLEQGSGCLLILDRLERMPGYGALCDALAELPRGSKALLIGRAQPPLLPGPMVEMPALEVAELAQIFGPDLVKRLEDLDPTGRLVEMCQEDLLLARMLRGELNPPMASTLLGGRPREGNLGITSQEVVQRMAQHAAGAFNEVHLRVLQALALVPGAVHRDTLAVLAGLTGEDARPAIQELERRGWIDPYGGGRFHMLASRLQAWAAEHCLTPVAMERMRGAWLRNSLAFLGEVKADVKVSGGARQWGLPMLAWNDERCEAAAPARVRRAHRLGVERSNLAELVWLLQTEGDWKGLSRLIEGAAVLSDLAETEELWRLMNMAQLAKAETRKDALAQAQALNRLAAPLLQRRRAPQARPLLEHALDLLGATPGWSVLGETYRLLSRCYEQLGRLEPAVNLLHNAVELAGQLGLPEDIPPACEALGRIWLRKGEERSEVRAFLEKQVQALREGGHGVPAAAVMRVMGDYLIRTGGAEEGLTLYTEALELCRETGADQEAAATLLALADGHLRRGEGDRALELLSMAEEQMGGSLIDPDAQGRILTGVCRIFEQRNLPDRALEGYLRIKRLLEEMGDRVALIAVLDRIGGLYYQLNEQDKATQCYEERLHLQEVLTMP